MHRKYGPKTEKPVKTVATYKAKNLKESICNAYRSPMKVKWQSELYMKNAVIAWLFLLFFLSNNICFKKSDCGWIEMFCVFKK